MSAPPRVSTRSFSLSSYIPALKTGLCLAIRGPSSSYCALVWQTRKNSGVEASIDPPNQTANRCMWWLMTLTSILFMVGGLPPAAMIFSSFARTRPSTRFFKSLWSRRPKSLNMVEPPERTMFLYRPRRTSTGLERMAWSTTSGSGVVWSVLKISGLKKISGPRKRSYPTSTAYSCLVRLWVPMYCLKYFAGEVSKRLNSFTRSGHV